MAGVPKDDLPDNLVVPQDDLPDSGAPVEESPAVRWKRSKLTPQQIERKAGEWGGTGTRTGKAIAELTPRAVVGALLTPVAGLAGAGVSLLKGPEAGAETVNKIQDWGQQKVEDVIPMTESTREFAGKAQDVAHTLNTPLREGGRILGEALGGEKGGAVGETMGEALPQALPAAKGAAEMTEALGAASAIKPKLTQPQDAVLRAKQAGYLVPTEETNPTLGNKVATAVAGRDALGDELATKNAEVTTKIVKQELGIPQDQFLNRGTLANLRKKYGSVYQELKNKDLHLVPDEQFRQTMMDVDRDLHAHKATYPDIHYDPHLEQVRAAILNPRQPPSTGVMVDTIADLRQRATRLFKKQDATYDDMKAAASYRKVADAMEDFIDRKLQTSMYTGTEAQPLPALGGPVQRGPAMVQGPANVPSTQFTMGGDPLKTGGMPAPGPQPGAKYGTLQQQPTTGGDLVQRYRAARQALAKLNDVEAATNLETGHVDPEVLSRIQKNGGKLSGGLEQVAQAHNAMPHAVRSVEKGRQIRDLRAGDATVGRAVLATGKPVLAGVGLGGAVAGGPGAAAGAVAGLAFPWATRKLMSSPQWQRAMANPSASNLAQLRAIGPEGAKAAAYLAAQAAGPVTDNLPPKKDEVPTD